MYLHLATLHPNILWNNNIILIFNTKYEGARRAYKSRILKSVGRYNVPKLILQKILISRNDQLKTRIL